jgi:ubiquinone/menaquinone biosynthesis C-methylase UbiE
MSSLVEQKFGAAAADYAASTVHAKGPSLARAVALAAPHADWSVLDVATGAGHTALAFAPLVAEVVASDVTEEMLAQARALAAERGLANVTTARMDAAALKAPDASFDLVTCRLAAHHFPDPAAFVREAHRVLKPGGALILIDNIAPETAPAERAYHQFEKLRDPSHARCLSLPEWIDLIKETGFGEPSFEVLDQDIGFDAWVKRMRCDAPTTARLQAMLEEEPLHSILKPRVIESGFIFTLKEAIIVARKAGGA